MENVPKSEPLYKMNIFSMEVQATLIKKKPLTIKDIKGGYSVYITAQIMVCRQKGYIYMWELREANKIEQKN